jgi:hypothetical protein
MADAREREQPGTVPGPRDDRETSGPRGQDRAAGARHGADGTLAWPLTAMSEALRRLAAVSAADIPQAVAAATEAVWWVTLADAAVSRCHPRAYGTALAALDPGARRAVEGSFAGLRFIRGQLGHHADPGDFIQSRQLPAAALPRPQRGPGRPSPRRPRTAARPARPARTASTGPTSPAGPWDRRWDGPPASSRRPTSPPAAPGTAAAPQPRGRP